MVPVFADSQADTQQRRHFGARVLLSNAPFLGPLKEVHGSGPDEEEQA